MKRVVVLGSTGSIGTQTLDVISQHPDRLQVVGLAANTNREKLHEQAEKYKVKRTALYSDGMEGIVELATMSEADIVVVSVAGVIGLVPTLEAIKAGKQIALASKEVLVAAGEIVMPLVRRHGTILTPIDSEHSAIFQCLEGSGRAGVGPRDSELGARQEAPPSPTPSPSAAQTSEEGEGARWPCGPGYEQDQIESLYLTASGGPFRGKTRKDLENVTPEQALAHPTWRMGGKITVDSATLMNKGLETIEAHWLFGVPTENVHVVVHPQSILHSMVKFKDGSVLAQLGWPDMRLPISYALLYPERVPNLLPPWNPMDSPSLTFEEVDHQTFPSIRLAQEAARIGGTMPCAMNAANEEAANAFLSGRIRFLQISEIVERAMEAHRPTTAVLETVLTTDDQTREFVRRVIVSL